MLRPRPGSRQGLDRRRLGGRVAPATLVSSRIVSGWVPALALLSALILAIATVLIRQGLRDHGPYTGYWVNLASI